MHTQAHNLNLQKQKKMEKGEKHSEEEREHEEQEASEARRCKREQSNAQVLDIQCWQEKSVLIGVKKEH